MSKIYVGDYPEIEVEVAPEGEDVSTATTIEIWVTKPEETSWTKWTASTSP